MPSILLPWGLIAVALIADSVEEGKRGQRVGTLAKERKNEVLERRLKR